MLPILQSIGMSTIINTAIVIAVLYAFFHWCARRGGNKPKSKVSDLDESESFYHKS